MHYKTYLVISFAVMLTGCASTQSDTRTVRLNHKEANIKAVCGYKAGCVIVSGNSCEILAPKPKDHLDHQNIEAIGHELFVHCFGQREHL